MFSFLSFLSLCQSVATKLKSSAMFCSSSSGSSSSCSSCGSGSSSSAVEEFHSPSSDGDVPLSQQSHGASSFDELEINMLNETPLTRAARCFQIAWQYVKTKIPKQDLEE